MLQENIYQESRYQQQLSEFMNKIVCQSPIVYTTYSGATKAGCTVGRDAPESEVEDGTKLELLSLQ